MQINDEKYQRQLKGVEAWEASDYNGILDYFTGVGKTFTAFLCINHLEKIRQHSYTIVVPTAELEKQWRVKMSAYFTKKLMSRVTIKTVQTIIAEGFEYHTDVLIVDEYHEFASDERIKIVNGNVIKAPKILALTSSTDDKNFWKLKKLLPIIDTIKEQEAIEKGYVSDSVEYNLALELTKTERESYDKLTTIIERYMPRFGNDLVMANNVLYGGKDKQGVFWSGAKYAQAFARKAGWHKDLNLSIPTHRALDDVHNPSNYINYARVLTNAVRNRKIFLCNCTAKVNTTVELVLKFRDVKSIVFSESTDFANKIHEILNIRKHPTVVYHSKLKTIVAPSEKTGKPIKYGGTRLKKMAIEKITNGKAKTLIAGSGLDKGLDVPDLRFSLTTSGTQNVTQYKQRNGRTKRKEDGIEVPVLLVNLYIIDTQDEIWLRNRQQNSNNNPIVVNSVDEITFKPQPNAGFTLNDL